MRLRRLARSTFITVGVCLLVAALLLGTGCAATPAPAPTTAPAASAPTQAAPAAAPTTAAPQSSGTERDYILIGRPDPVTGPLAGLGEGSQWAEDRILAEINKNGGIMVDGKKKLVKTKLVDTESNPTKAAEVAAKLILDDKVDLMEVQMTPDTVNPVTAQCERYGVPCIAIGAPPESWMTGGPYKWSYLSFFTVDTLLDTYIDLWDTIPTNKIVGGLFANDPDGVATVPVVQRKAEERGYKFVLGGNLPYGTKDFSATINKFKEAGAEILISSDIAPDTTQAWRQMHQQGWVPKVATIAKAALLPSDIASYGGDLAENISCEIWWHPSFPYKSSITGETPKQLSDAWVKENNKQSIATIGFKHAGLEIVADVLKRAGTLDKEKLREAIAQTNLNTIIGRISYNDQHWGETPLVGGQWQKGKDFPWEVQVVNNKRNPSIPTTSTMAPIR